MRERKKFCSVLYYYHITNFDGLIMGLNELKVEFKEFDGFDTVKEQENTLEKFNIINYI